MQTIIKKLSELTRPEKNIRIHTERQLKEFEKSIHMFGQIRPIVIDENSVILAGNGLYETLIRMGKEDAVCYQYIGLTENQKKKLMIADNKIFSLGIDKLDTLNDFLEDLRGDLDIPGFDEEILRQMVSDAEEVTEKIVEYGTLDEEEIQVIRDSNERREQKHEESPETVPFANSAPEQNETVAEVQKSVSCPKCGEKIWL